MKLRSGVDNYMDQNDIRRIDFVFHLEKAIENNEFEVYFQPIIHTISGSLCGFEALVRWHHPTLGFLMPGQFLPSLEETQQIYHLDVHIVEKVCQWYATLKSAGEPIVPVSVNLSRIDFEAVDIFSAIQKLTAKYGMPHNMLNIEITESAFSRGRDLMQVNLARFHHAGYQVWMDDFGSGYSSLNTLKDYAFDQLKIDMLFLSDMNLRSRRIIRSIISMAKDISMVTLVEGVETEEQVAFLKDIGCDRMQGYYFSRPMPYDELLKLLKEKGISFETEEDRKYYHEINRINLLSPSPFTMVSGDREGHRRGIPLAILEKRGEEYQFIYQDEEFRQSLHMLGAADAMDAIQKLVHFGVLTRQEIDSFLVDTIRRGEKEINFTIFGDLCSAHAKLVSSNKGRYAMLLAINNITQTININHEQLVDQSLMNIYSMYLRVSILRPEKDEMVTLFSQDHHNLPTDEIHPMNEMIEHFASVGVHPSERSDYLDFLDASTLQQRIKHSKRGFINAKILTQDEDGGYSRKMYLAVPTGNHEILLLVRYANL